MNREEKENSNFLRMTISDPELVQKICESGLENLSPDDLNSLGMEVKDGHISLGDASLSDPEGGRRIKFKTFTDRISVQSPLRRGFGKFIAFLIVILAVLSVTGIICLQIKPQIDLTNKDVFFLSLVPVVGLGICMSEFRTAAAAQKYLTERVQAKCISHDISSGNLNSRRSVFEYTYKDKVYRRCENVFANKGYARIGEIRELMISSDNPQCIYDPIAGKARKIGGITIGMIFIVITVIIVISLCINS